MIVFPDQSISGHRRTPLLALITFAAVLALAVASALQIIHEPDWWLLALAGLLVLAVATSLEFAVGHAIFALCVLLSALAAYGLHFVVLKEPAGGLDWLPMGVAALCGVSLGLFRKWWLRPLYFLGSVAASLTIPAYVPVVLWLGVMAGTAFLGGEVNLLVAALCAATGSVIGVAMNGLSLLEPGIASEEYLERVVRRGLRDSEELIREHKLSKARRVIAGLSTLAPRDLSVLRARYAVWKYHPQRPEFHAAAADLLNQEGTDAQANRLVSSVYRDYMAVTQGKPQLPADLHLSLARRFASDQRVEEAANIVNVFLQRNIEHRGLPEAILDLAQGYVRVERYSKAAHYADTLIALYPQSSEANEAYKMLQQLDASLI